MIVSHTIKEVEEIFFNRKWVPLGIQVSPEVGESRYGILGETDEKRLLFVAFTLRGNSIRVISTRSMNAKERKLYEQIRKN